MTDSGATKPGWYPRPDMQDTLGFWDGRAWTDQTQPAPVTQKQERGRNRALAVVLVAVAVLFFGYQIVTSDDDLQCLTENSASDC